MKNICSNKGLPDDFYLVIALRFFICNIIVILLFIPISYGLGFILNNAFSYEKPYDPLRFLDDQFQSSFFVGWGAAQILLISLLRLKTKKWRLRIEKIEK